MFKKPRTGREAKNFVIKGPKILNLKWNRYFPKIDFGCPYGVLFSDACPSTLISVITNYS